MKTKINKTDLFFFLKQTGWSRDIVQEVYRKRLSNHSINNVFLLKYATFQTCLSSTHSFSLSCYPSVRLKELQEKKDNFTPEKNHHQRTTKTYYWKSTSKWGMRQKNNTVVQKVWGLWWHIGELRWREGFLLGDPCNKF